MKFPLALLLCLQAAHLATAGKSKSDKTNDPKSKSNKTNEPCIAEDVDITAPISPHPHSMSMSMSHNSSSSSSMPRPSPPNLRRQHDTSLFEEEADSAVKSKSGKSIKKCSSKSSKGTTPVSSKSSKNSSTDTASSSDATSTSSTTNEAIPSDNTDSTTLPNDTGLDTDNEGLTDMEETVIHNTDPNNPDTDGDGLNDFDEVKQYGTDPLNPDSDTDGLTDFEEGKQYGSDPNNADTDSDGLNDFDEVKVYGTNPLTPDTDMDAYTDYEEIKDFGTNPLDPKSNGTGMDITDSTDAAIKARVCEALNKGEVYRTNNPYEIQFVFEAAIDNKWNPDDIVGRLDTNAAQFVGRELIDCEGVEDGTGSRQGGRPGGLVFGGNKKRSLRSLMVDGIDSSPEDVITGTECVYFNDDALPSGTSCYVVDAKMTLHLRDDAMNGESANDALQALIAEFNNKDPSPFVEGSGSTMSIQGLKGVRFMYQGEPIDTKTPSESGEVDTRSASDDNGLSTGWIIGISAISVGAVAIIAGALFAMGKKRNRSGDEASFAKMDDDKADDDGVEGLGNGSATLATMEGMTIDVEHGEGSQMDFDRKDTDEKAADVETGVAETGSVQTEESATEDAQTEVTPEKKHVETGAADHSDNSEEHIGDIESTPAKEGEVQ
mmetsp:Transcript_12427/g.27152  ORF Transcript_12427/g.27152 Transcript_12427/m.27152 type:complete len:660 (+) Transcript_12427:169-2148(+)